MADAASIIGDIGGITQPIFIGTSGLSGTGGNNPIGELGKLGSLSVGDLGTDKAGPNITMNNSAASSGIADFFFRAVIIILGFIFMAVGLSMFKPGVIIETTTRHAKKAFSK